MCRWCVSVVFLFSVWRTLAVTDSLYSYTIAVDTVAEVGEKRPLEAVLMVAGINWGVWAFDRYVQNADFARIGFDTMGTNLRTGLIWDNDKMGTNMLLHPYHGGLYFSTARDSGFNYWQSALFAFGGSAMWEFLMESEYPSTSDIIATPVGGMVVGELSYRISDLVVDNSSTGLQRAGREFATFIISPMRGLCRVICGDAWRRKPFAGRVFGEPHLNMRLSLGTRMLAIEGSDAQVGAAIDFAMDYGDRYSASHALPFDCFTMRLSLNAQRSQPVLGRLNIMGRLINKPLVDNTLTDLNIGLYQHLDYFDSDSLSKKMSVPYKLSVPASVGVGAMCRHNRFLGGSIDTELHANCVLLGGVLSDYYRVDERDYNFVSGFGLKARGSFSSANERLSLSASYEFYRLYSWQGYAPNVDWDKINPKTLNVQGDRSQSSFHIVELGLQYRLTKNLSVGLAFMNLLRHSSYSYNDDVKATAFERKLQLSYSF